jgi:hypothetical protein
VGRPCRVLCRDPLPFFMRSGARLSHDLLVAECAPSSLTSSN